MSSSGFRFTLLFHNPHFHTHLISPRIAQCLETVQQLGQHDPQLSPRLRHLHRPAAGLPGHHSRGGPGQAEEEGDAVDTEIDIIYTHVVN